MRDILTFPFKIIFSRFLIAIILILLQIAVIFVIFFFFEIYVIYFIGGIGVLDLILIIYLINKNINSEFKTAWIIFILLLPPFGALFYLFCQSELGVIAIKKRLAFRKKENKKYLPQNELVLNDLKQINLYEFYHAKYLNAVGHFPISRGCNLKYFPLGDDFYPDLLNNLKEAKDFIFIEIFILAKGKMWNEILEILKQKAKEGVEVRILYDGTCSLTLLKRTYPEELKNFGIKCLVFSPIVPVISTSYNNRDHRKIFIIDGKYGYTGGANIADEYINKLERFGHWKDTMIRFSGDVVNNFTVLFLEMWNLICKKDVENYNNYLVKNNIQTKDGFVIGFGDDPLDNEQVGKETYLHILKSATKKVDIIMPYFIVDGDFLNEIIHTSLKGIQVRLIMPGIPDKKLINYVAKTFYKDLLDAGVLIYEYKKGFTHAKMMIGDNDKALIGTINLDYRSLYLHYEDGVYLYRASVIKDMLLDYEKTILMCDQITHKEFKKYSKFKLLIGKVLRLFGPLL